MTRRDDGGQAFPKGGFAYRDEGFDDGHDGMTLRDYFAAKSLQPICSAVFTEANGTLNESIFAEAERRRLKPYEEIARRAYEMADAMLAERVK